MEDLKTTDHSEDPAYVTLKVKKQVRALVAATNLPLTRLIRMEMSLISGLNA